MTKSRRAGEAGKRDDEVAEPEGEVRTAEHEPSDEAEHEPADGQEDQAVTAGPEDGSQADETDELDETNEVDEATEMRRERDEYLELARRTKADFENYRRRAAREAGEAERRGKSGLARELVPVLDNLERALRAAELDPDAEGSDGVGDGDALSHGVLLVYRDLRSAVQRSGVETYDPAGERFDPTWHEALSTRPGDGDEPGTVIETVEKGYRLADQVLRPARVIVSE